MDIHQIIGKRIREEREKENLTLEELAEKCDRSPSFLAYIERGKRKASLETIGAIADGLRIPIWRLFSSIKPTNSGKEHPSINKISLLMRNKKPRQQKFIIELLKVISKEIGNL